MVHVAASLSPPRATTLLRVILDDPDPAGRFLRRSQRLALRCLVDGSAVADRALLAQIFMDGEVIGGSRWLGIAIRFIGLLKQLLVTRYEAEAQQMLLAMEGGAMEGGAKQELPANDSLVVYLSSHDLPEGPRNGAPGTVYRKRLGGRPVQLVWADWRRRIEDPQSWYDEVLKLVRDPETELPRRMALLSFLGEEAGSNHEARQALEKLLVHDQEPTIRAACAEALEEALTAHPRTAKLLLSRLDKEKTDIVRERCAAALSSVAANHTEVLDRLKALFTSAPERVRAGAARGLSQVDFTTANHQPLRDLF